MNFTYENQGTTTYLVYTVSAEDDIDSMGLGMLTNNKIPGLANTLFTQMDSTKYIKYNVSAHIPVSQFFAGAVNRKRLLGVFKGVVSAILSAEDYMIDENEILLDLDYIFADVSNCETILICLPVENEAKHHDFGAFFKGIMFSTQFDQTENCDYVAKIINYLNSSPLFSLNDFKELLEQIDQSDSAPTFVPNPVQPRVIPASQEQKPAQQTQQAQQPSVRPAVVPAQQTVQPQAPANAAEQKVPVAQQAGDSGTNKGFSLFGFRSSKSDKKDTKPQPAKQPAKAPYVSAFEIPGSSALAPKTTFEVPGQPAAPSTPVQKQAPAAPVAPKPAVAPQPVAPKQAVAATCPKCGQPVKPGQAFCTNCGTRCGASPAPTPAPSAAPAPVAPQPAYQQPSGTPLNFGETTVLNAARGETTVLSTAEETKQYDPHLIRTKNNEKIPLNKPVFRIGKERSYVDYFISDNTAISRGHANFVDHNGEFYVVDTNSTNHTYVNGMMIQSGVETKLSHGDKVRLANEDFEFRLY